ncbi:hypothetical protein AAIB41_11600 [Brucella sp. BE17]|uniref:hypothetical protein n=1 Tax=Brucella sp. BE17 TaxID=3142977 RepID=UPI0031BBB079
MLKHIAIVLAIVSVQSPVFAQDIFVPPVTTASPGYLFPNDQYQRDRENAGSSRTPKAAPAQVELDDAAKARVRAAIQALVPEYNRRARRDGKESANRWIGQKAFALGQEEAKLMKKRRGID